MKFIMELEPHEPSNKEKPCEECILSSGAFMCLDKSYCKFRETGKTWKQSLPPAEGEEEVCTCVISWPSKIKFCFCGKKIKEV